MVRRTHWTAREIAEIALDLGIELDEKKANNVLERAVEIYSFGKNNEKFTEVLNKIIIKKYGR